MLLPQQPQPLWAELAAPWDNCTSAWSLGPQGSVPAPGTQGEPGKGPARGTEQSFSVLMDTCTLSAFF